MQNPFEEIFLALQQLKDEVKKINSNAPDTKIEIIDRAELCRRLHVSEPTVIKWAKNKTIPQIEIDAVIRYNWIEVVEKLKKRKK